MKALLSFFILTLLLSACTTAPVPTAPPTEPTSTPSAPPTVAPTPPPTEAPTPSATETPTIPITEAPTEGKILLKLQQFPADPNPEETERTYAETQECSLWLEDTNLPETPLKTYENDPFLEGIAGFLNEEFDLTLDDSWKFYIHYYTEDQSVGIVSLVYWIDNEIATNRAVTFPIENNTIRLAIYSYLDRSADESVLLQKRQDFLSTYEQERINVLGDAFEIDLETTNFIYNYRTEELIYSYNIFYRHIESGIIVNDYGTEMLVE